MLLKRYRPCYDTRDPTHFSGEKSHCAYMRTIWLDIFSDIKMKWDAREWNGPTRCTNYLTHTGDFHSKFNIHHLGLWRCVRFIRLRNELTDELNAARVRISQYLVFLSYHFHIPLSAPTCHTQNQYLRHPKSSQFHSFSVHNFCRIWNHFSLFSDWIALQFYTSELIYWRNCTLSNLKGYNFWFNKSLLTDTDW